ncbi:MAG: hypothetical protein A2X18_12850 [Bacteroidetes bacterium GWF2_40_14]|nr:MAG: hypothetical protein A2X18_12850 [Bacteroidetes bacterium GWF2_40_14]
MKKYIITLFLFMGLVSSCDLKEDPYGIYSKENMFSNEAGAQSVLLSAYRSLCDVDYSIMLIYFGDMTTDIAYNNRMDDQPYPEITEWKISALANNIWILNFYKTLYRTINSACDVIENVPGATFPEAAKSRILGEAYFLRGYAYYQLAWMYGKVPMKLTTTESFPKLAKDLDEVYGQIIKDLTESEKLLTISRSPGCADKVAAWAMLAKTYLFLASAKENNALLYKDMTSVNVTSYYTEAAKWAKKVVDNPEQTVYSLDPNIYNVYDCNKQNGQEHIFLLSHYRSGSSTEGDYSKLPRYFLPGNGGAAFYVKSPVNGSYGITCDGWSVCVATDKLRSDMEVASAIDKRLTFFHNAYYKKSGENYVVESMVPQNLTHYVYTSKFLDVNAEGTERTSVPSYLIRFSEIVLVYAEALGKTEGLQWLNRVTARVNGRQYQASEFANDAQFRSAILQERAFEFCFEHKRLEDLRRFNLVRTMVQGKKCFGRADTDLSSVTDVQLAFFPIPQREIDLNPNLK